MFTDLDPMLLARIQIAMQLSFHIIFPTINIGLAAQILLQEYLWLKTGNKYYLKLCHFFTKIFALAFGVGVVTGITLSFMFGTNFAKFSLATANVLGPLLSYEVMTAFFLESTFLGVMIFGWKKVSKQTHFAASLIVYIGTLLSAFWILSANSWMQTPAGFRIENGVFYPESWLKIIFNPSFIYRYIHMVLAATISGSIIVASINSYYLLRGLHKEFAQRGFKIAALTVMLLIPVQIIVGDLHGLNTLKHQPVKVAAMEGHWEETQKGAPLYLFGIPDKEAEKTKFSIKIPKLGSLILTHSLDGEVAGLKSVNREDRPVIEIVFYSFRVMLAIGFFLLILSLYTGYKIYRKEAFNSLCHLKLWQYSAPLGIIATIAGWYVTECGRFPWVVYGIMRVEDALSNIGYGPILWSLIMFSLIYIVLAIAFIYYLKKLVQKGPDIEFAKEIMNHNTWFGKEK